MMLSIAAKGTEECIYVETVRKYPLLFIKVIGTGITLAGDKYKT